MDTITRGDKPLAITEVSSPPDMQKLQDEQIPWLWFMLWYGFVDNKDNNTHELVKAAYNHPYALSEKDLREYHIY